ncbi:hypothetical protein [Cereibacter sphaeroides]|nr:hypothetical protein [Cereibacter sphaeroides]
MLPKETAATVEVAALANKAGVEVSHTLYQDQKARLGIAKTFRI